MMNLKQTKKIKQSSAVRPSNNLNPIQPAEKQSKALLKDQKSKIQSKLEALKAEIAERKNNKSKPTETKQAEKQKKQFGKTSTTSRWRTSGPINAEHIQKFLGSTQQNSKTSQKRSQKSQLEQVLASLKMQKFSENIISQKKIRDMSDFLKLDEEQIDNWKDIPVGYRIKLKKLIKEHEKQEGEKLGTPSAQKNQIQKQQMNIEDIIERRKQSRVFMPITDKPFDEEQCEQDYRNMDEVHSQDENNGKQGQNWDEDIMMNSLNMAFLGRKSMMKNESHISENSSVENNSKHEKKEVKWGQDVKIYRSEDKKGKKALRELNTKYPSKDMRKKFQLVEQEETKTKETSSWVELKRTNKQTTEIAQYCWSCLKKFEKNGLKLSNREFCSEICQANYLQATNLAQIEQQIQEQELKLERLTLMRDSMKKIEKEEEEFDEEDVIDLEVM